MRRLSVPIKSPKQRPHKQYYLKKIIAAWSLAPKSKVFGSRVFKVMLNKEMGLSQIYKN